MKDLVQEAALREKILEVSTDYSGLTIGYLIIFLFFFIFIIFNIEVHCLL